MWGKGWLLGFIFNEGSRENLIIIQLPVLFQLLCYLFQRGAEIIEMLNIYPLIRALVLSMFQEKQEA